MTSTWRPHAEVELIVGTPPGGGQDRPARAMMNVLRSSGLVDVPMRLTNITGKGGGDAWDAVRRRPGTPHVLSVSSAPLLTNKVVGVSDFDHAELTTVATLYTESLAFIVPSASPLRTAEELLERLKSDPGGLAIAIATALATTNHIATARIVQHLGGDPRRLNLHVFDSALLALADVVETKADVGVISAASAVKALQAGTIRTLAVSAPTRMRGVFAGIPTWAELSVPCTMGLWRGIVGAPGIGAAELAYWEEALAAAVASPAWTAELEQQYWTATWKGAADTRAFLDGERAVLTRMLTDLGLTP